MFQNQRTMLSTTLLCALVFAVSVGDIAIAGESGGATGSGSGSEFAAVTQVVDRYVAAMQNGSSEELKTIYLPQASFYFFREEKMVGGPIELLHKMVEGNPIPAPIEYTVTAVNISGPIATLTLDLTNIGGAHIIDMFTLIKDGDSWMIASKVARRPDSVR